MDSKKCDRCGKKVYWRQSKAGNWYLSNKSGKPHYLTCQAEQKEFKPRDRKASKAAILKNQLDEAFERAIAK